MVTLAEKTGGQAVTLDSAALLGDVLLGGAMEELGLERLMREVADEAAGAAAQAAAEGGALDDDAIAERVAAAMQSRGTRCYQMKHNAKIVAPHAAQLKASPGLAAWRSAMPAVEERPRGRPRGGRPPPPPMPCAAPMAPAMMPPGGGRGGATKKLKARGGDMFGRARCSLEEFESKEDGGDAGEFLGSRGATVCTTEEAVISKDQIARTMLKAKAKKMW